MKTVSFSLNVNYVWLFSQMFILLFRSIGSQTCFRWSQLNLTLLGLLYLYLLYWTFLENHGHWTASIQPFYLVLGRFSERYRP